MSVIHTFWVTQETNFDSPHYAVFFILLLIPLLGSYIFLFHFYHISQNTHQADITKFQTVSIQYGYTTSYFYPYLELLQ